MKTNQEIPNATEEPLKATYLKLHQIRSKMSSDLYDEHEEVRDWAMDVEWAYTALSEHEDVDIEKFYNE